MSNPHRRRIDRALEQGFTEGLDAVELEELRERRAMCNDLELELSFHRRLLHGRMDLLAFEMRRRVGEEGMSLVEALPQILAEGGYGSAPGLPERAVPVEAPGIVPRGRRLVDRALDLDFLMRMATMSDDELRDTQAFLTEVEVEVSKQRSQIHAVIERLQAELVQRYREGLAQLGEQALGG